MFTNPEHRTPAIDSTANGTMAQVIGNKEDLESLTADVASVVALARMAAKRAWEGSTHHHSGERWFGAAASASGETHIADRIGAGDAGAEAGLLIVDAGNDDWGTWTQVLGSCDTPIDSGSATHFDFHRIIIHAAENTAQRYMIQIALQEDAPDDDPDTSDIYTEFEVLSRGPGATSGIQPSPFQAERVTAGTKVWMRTRAPDQNTSTLSFYIGIHEYTDPDT